MANASFWPWRTSTTSSVSTISVVIDHFKRINDQRGHEAGDECLMALADILKNKTQRPLDAAIRLGGEEFLVCWDDTSQEQGMRLARSIQEELRASPHKHADGSDLTLSIGMCPVLPTANQDLEDIIRTADQALYRAKASGRDRIEMEVVTG